MLLHAEAAGRIQLAIGNNNVDIRVSTLPTLFGESVVLRILDRTVVQLDLNKIGMPPDTLVAWRELIKKPNGIMLVHVKPVSASVQEELTNKILALPEMASPNVRLDFMLPK